MRSPFASIESRSAVHDAAYEPPAEAELGRYERALVEGLTAFLAAWFYPLVWLAKRKQKRYRGG